VLENVVTMIRQRPGMLTVTEAAQLTGLARRTVYAMAEQGRIPHYRIGGALRFDPVELADWLERQKAA
jgi:excisionase family DNA binding protein